MREFRSLAAKILYLVSLVLSLASFGTYLYVCICSHVAALKQFTINQETGQYEFKYVFNNSAGIAALAAIIVIALGVFLILGIFKERAITLSIIFEIGTLICAFAIRAYTYLAEWSTFNNIFNGALWAGLTYTQKIETAKVIKYPFFILCALIMLVSIIVENKYEKNHN